MNWPLGPITALAREPHRFPPRMVLSEEACLIHGDVFRHAKVERVRGLLCPYCDKGVRGVVTEARKPLNIIGRPTLVTREFEKTPVTWRIIEPNGEHITGEALAWAEVT